MGLIILGSLCNTFLRYVISKTFIYTNGYSLNLFYMKYPQLSRFELPKNDNQVCLKNLVLPTFSIKIKHNSDDKQAIKPKLIACLS